MFVPTNFSTICVQNITSNSSHNYYARNSNHVVVGTMVIIFYNRSTHDFSSQSSIW
jgi:hypothetical protein